MNGDAELLRRYADASSQDAFAEFVARHIDLVYHAALRQLGGDPHRAKDVTQLVFTDLARKARTVCGHPAIVSWLHKSTRYAAAKIRRAEQNRHKYEREAQTMDAIWRENELPADWERLRPLIDDALDDLNDRDREAVLLRFFEGRNFAEVGAALALSENSARMRVERALDKLHGLLARRGITSKTAALAAMFAEQGSGAAPAGLAASVAAVALSGAGGSIMGPGAAAALGGLLIGSKGTVTLGVIGALAVGAAVYQTTQARAAAALLADARTDYAALRARLANVEIRTPTASQAQPDRGTMATNVAAANARGGNVSASMPVAVSAADAEKATQQKALQQFVDRDPELRKLRRDEARLKYMAGTGLFLRSIGFTLEQLEQAAENYMRNRELAQDARDTGLPPPKLDPNRPTFRTMFGEAAAERFAHWNKTWAATQLVNELSSGLFFADDPLTREQAQRLAEIIDQAKLPTAPKNISASRLSEFVDWEKITVEGESILSPAQLKGVGNRAALARAPDPAIRSPDIPSLK